jgi:hypothetical protein
LLPQGKILQKQIAAGTEGSSSQYEHEPQQAQHEASLTRKETRNWLNFYLADCAADHNFGDAQGYAVLPFGGAGLVDADMQRVITVTID